VIDPERPVIESAEPPRASSAQVSGTSWRRRSSWPSRGFFLTRYGTGLNGFEIAYLAAHHARAERVLYDRFGEFATTYYDGASNHTFRAMRSGAGRRTTTDCMGLWATQSSLRCRSSIGGSPSPRRRLHRLPYHCPARSTPWRPRRHRRLREPFPPALDTGVKPPTIRVGRGSHCIYPCPVTEGYVERADRSRWPLQLTLLAALLVCDGQRSSVRAM
jgi:hypothetical protein